MKRASALTALILTVVLQNSIPVRAQEPAVTVVGTWEGIKSLPPKDELTIKLKDGNKKKGHLNGVTNTALTISQGKRTLEITRDSIFQIYRSVPKSREKGTWIGAFVGAGFGLLSGLAGDGSDGHGVGAGGTVAAVFMGAGMGALIGRGLSSGHDRALIYEARR